MNLDRIRQIFTVVGVIGLAGLAVLTVTKLRQTQPLAPTAPQSKPQAAVPQCVASFAIAGASTTAAPTQTGGVQTQPTSPLALAPTSAGGSGNQGSAPPGQPILISITPKPTATTAPTATLKPTATPKPTSTPKLTAAPVVTGLLSPVVPKIPEAGTTLPTFAMIGVAGIILVLGVAALLL